MPGPSNGKKKQKQKGRAKHRSEERCEEEPVLDSRVPQTVEEVMFQPPFIHDPGNGPRVRDAKMFMDSFFAQPPTLDDPLCREFAQEEVLEMLKTVLPEETALIMWYNKSRLKSRICPACHRLYRVGDVLQDLMDEDKAQVGSGIQQREQEISGLCSPVCFVVASIEFPGAIKTAWGHTGDEMDETVWDMLNVEMGSRTLTSRALGLVVKMTRLDDLGLGQLCLDL